MVRETSLSPSNLISPLFVREGEGGRTPITSMPGQFQLRLEHLPDEARNLASLGIPAVILFGIPDRKDPAGSENYNENGIIPRAIRRIREAAPDLIVISDLCFCEYTDHGHCGLVNREGESFYNPRLPPGYLLNDATLELLAAAAIVHARAGADIIAPSGMVDNMVAAIRGGLDSAGLEHVAIMSYAAKYASAFYGPFREAASSAPAFGDRSTYQMDAANAREALREVEIDVRQGADIILVKPAMPCLDVISAVHARHNLPIAAYQVSGEYAMLHAAAANGWLDLKRCAMESLTAIRRAGADLILTYFARDAAQWLQEAPR
jgi:porphobilinogen synthase